MYSLFCIIDGSNSLFLVEIEESKKVGALKKAIKNEKEHELRDYSADQLKLYKIHLDQDQD